MILRHFFGIRKHWTMTSNRINLISGPRNISTALMYAFDSRPDTEVVDEPMYGYYLHASGALHPVKELIMSSLPTDLQMVIDDIIFKSLDKPYYFIKGMAHHYYNADASFILPLSNVFLIRDPALLITSFQQIIERPTMQDIGLSKEYELYSLLLEHGKSPIVIEAGELLKDPEKVLRALCERLEMPFSRAMLSWPPGPKKADGVWAPYWYSSVHQTTGFNKKTTKARTFPKELKNLLDEAMPYYEKLYEYAIKA